MHDPDFEAAVAGIRGFDLGDGGHLLAELDARGSEGLGEEEWLLRGVLLYQAGKHDDALECFDEAIERGSAPARPLYLKSCLLRDLQRVGEALETLIEAREAAATDPSISAAELDHAHGLLFWRVDRPEDALREIDRGLELEPTMAARWLHRGQLLAELDRVDEAVAAFDRALLEEQDLHRAMYERAALEAKRGDAAAAAQWLTKAVHLDPEQRTLALEDPRFADLREHEALASLLAPERAADLHWLDGLATWMSELRGALELSRLGLSWLGEAESRSISEALAAEYEEGPLGTMHTEETLGRSRELLQRRVAVARGPASRTREGQDEPCVLFVDKARADQGLWLALSVSYPPFLWIPVAPRSAAVTEALAEFFPRSRRTRIDMPPVARGFLGYRSRFVVPSPYTGGLEPATIVELDRHFAINPFVESASWGSACADDPWPDEIPEQPDLTHKITLRQHGVAEQARGHIWSLTRRTRHSRSYLSIEVHHDEIFVVELRYQPSWHPEVIEAMNTHFGCAYPTDLPVDAVAALLGFQFDDTDDLEARLNPEQPEELAGLLYVISALRHADPGVLALYRHTLGHADPVVRSTIADISLAYNYEALLEEMSLRESDPVICEELEEILDEGIPIVEVRDGDLDEEPYELQDADLLDEDDDEGGARRE